MKGVSKYIVAVDLAEPMRIAVGDSYLQGKEQEGDAYQNMPFWGRLVAAPPESPIPVGEVVYMNYMATEELMFMGGTPCYVIDLDLIVAWGEAINAIGCVVLEPYTDRIKSEFIDVVQFDLPECTKGKILSSGVPGFSSGDLIQYRHNADWEFFIGREKHFYIKSTHYIVTKNNELIDTYVEIELPQPTVTIPGMGEFPNTDPRVKVVNGEFAGNWVYLYRKEIIAGRYIKKVDIAGIDQ